MCHAKQKIQKTHTRDLVTVDFQNKGKKVKLKPELKKSIPDEYK